MKLCQHHRDTIVKRAVKKSFEKREAQLVKEEAALAVEAYNSLFDADTRKKVNAIPKTWFRHCDCLMFTVNGQYHQLKADRQYPTPGGENGCRYLGALEGEIAEQVLEHVKAKNDLQTARNQAESKLLGTLSNISTFAKLADLWPEGKAFYADLDEDAKLKSGLPAIRFEDVNKVLGLTPEAV